MARNGNSTITEAADLFNRETGDIPCKGISLNNDGPANMTGYCEPIHVSSNPFTLKPGESVTFAAPLISRLSVTPAASTTVRWMVTSV